MLMTPSAGFGVSGVARLLRRCGRRPATTKGAGFMPLRLLFIICSIGLTAASAQVPQLTVVSATSKQVQLTWTAAPGGSYSVYREPTVVTNSGIPGSSLNVSMPTDFASIVTVSTTSWTDSSFDPSATYTYFLGVGNNQFSNK